MTFKTLDQREEETKPEQRQRPWQIHVKSKCEIVIISDSWGHEFMTIIVTYIKIDAGQHSQFLRCFRPCPKTARNLFNSLITKQSIKHTKDRSKPLCAKLNQCIAMSRLHWKIVCIIQQREHICCPSTVQLDNMVMKGLFTPIHLTNFYSTNSSSYKGKQNSKINIYGLKV